jgi:DNA-binding MarR family transcriptional regulator
MKEHSEQDCARAWTALTGAHALLAERLGAALTRSCGLNVNEFEVLLRLDQVPPPGLRLHHLRETVRLSQPAVSRLIARLEEQGLIGTNADPRDGRGVLATISTAGRKKLRRAIPLHAQVVRECLLDRLTEDEGAQLSAILDRIVR